MALLVLDHVASLSGRPGMSAPCITVAQILQSSLGCVSLLNKKKIKKKVAECSSRIYKILHKLHQSEMADTVCLGDFWIRLQKFRPDYS